MNGTSRLLTLALLAAFPLVAQTAPPAPARPVAEAPMPLRPPPPALPEIVLSDATDEVPLADFDLGAGGVAATRGATAFCGEDGCVTTGGVRIVCRSVGVRLAFPSGRELLVAPDGALHLRSGEVAGPFPAGLELRLGDDTSVRVVLAQGRRDRLREVLVVDGDRTLQPWRRGRPAVEVARTRRWAGLRLCCCGDGGELYRPLALGPLIVLDRVLVPEERLDATPSERLVLLSAPLCESLAVMQRQHREPDAAVRRAVAAVAAVAGRGRAIFPAGAALQRAERDRPRWLLRGGFELQLDREGPLSPRLQLFAGQSPLPMVEWTLRADAAAFLTNPRDDQLGKRWHGNGTRLAAVAEDLQVREHLHERVHALRVLGRLGR